MTHVRRFCWQQSVSAVLFLLLMTKSPLAAVAKTSSSSSSTSPYSTIAEYLLRSDRKVKEFLKYTQRDVEKAVKGLADGTKALKNMDGVSHALNSAISEKSVSLSARYRKFEEMDLEQESKSVQKEASKVLEYVTTVERGLQCCELLQSMSITDHLLRDEYLVHAGVREIKRITISNDKVRVIFSILVPIIHNRILGRFASGEIVLAFVDDCSIENVLRMCTKPTKSIPLASVGLVSEDVTIYPTVLELAMQALENAREYLTPKMVPMVAVNSTIEELNNTVASLQESNVSLSGFPMPLKVRVLGHSVGGSVAAYVAMLLDGSLPISGERENLLRGRFRDNVRCLTVGCPPCVSRSLVPPYISSLICGDDIVPRAHSGSLSYMKSRILSSLRAKDSALRFIPGSTFLSDMASVASKGVASYTGNVHDLETVHVPGRVFFMKNRKHKNGVSFQRVFRGNWREDMLWSLRDVLLSSRMLEHHNLDAYIKTLMRC